MNCPTCHNEASFTFCSEYDYWCSVCGIGFRSMECDDEDEEEGEL